MCKGLEKMMPFTMIFFYKNLCSLQLFFSCSKIQKDVFLYMQKYLILLLISFSMQKFSN